MKRLTIALAFAATAAWFFNFGSLYNALEPVQTQCVPGGSAGRIERPATTGTNPQLTIDAWHLQPATGEL